MGSSFRSYSLYIFAAALLTASAVVTPKAAAENAYRWRDSSGRIIYGSRPPKGAGGVAKLNTPKLSRYSADKVLRRLGRSDLVGSRQRLSRGGRGRAPAVEDGFSYEPASLEPGKVLVSRDGELAVLSCSVEVENTGETPAGDVSVAFEFSDGSLVPAVGPDMIPAGEAAAYQLPDELTPMKLRLDGDDVKNLMQDPRVVVHGVMR